MLPFVSQRIVTEVENWTYLCVNNRLRTTGCVFVRNILCARRLDGIEKRKDGSLSGLDGEQNARIPVMAFSVAKPSDLI